MGKPLLGVVLALVATAAFPAGRAVPFWPDSVPEGIHRHVDGVAVLETVRELGRFHRVHGSPGMRAAAEYVNRRLHGFGISEATVETFPADGITRYAHFRSYLGWNPVEASLEEVSPHPHSVARFPDLPVALADYSQDADIETEIVDVGPGTDPENFRGKEIAGRLVLASGPLPIVHRSACEERGALGIVSDFPNQTTAWSGDDRDLVRWGHLSPYQTQNRFAFMVSRRTAGEFRARLARGEKVVLRAHVRARMVPASYDVVTATIPGSLPGEILLTAHLCHESAGANDNASGSAAILEVARVLHAAIADGTLHSPHRTIRFLFLPEIAGSEAYLIRHPEVAKSALAGIHMDMVGGLLSTTHGTFHLSRTAASHPHVVNVIAKAFFDEVVARSENYAEKGGDPYDGFSWPPGSREVFLGDIRRLELGSDHEVYEESSFGIPMVYFHDWPDVTIHTNKDQPENLDSTKLGRVSYLGAGIAWTLAALPEDGAGALLSLARAEAEEQIVAGHLAARLDNGRDGALKLRESLRSAVGTLGSLEALWPSTGREVRDLQTTLLAQVPQVPPAAAHDDRIPVRNPEVRGPLSVYYYDHLKEVLGEDVNTQVGLAAGDDVVAYEALNLVDGRRSVSEIRDVLSGLYQPVSGGDVGAYFELLERAHVIRFR